MRVYLGGPVAALVALTLMWAAPASAQQKLSLREFRDRYAAAIVHDVSGAQVKPVSDSELEVSINGAKPFQAYMDNAYKSYLNDPSNLDAILTQYIKGLRLASSNRADQVDPSNLVLLVRQPWSRSVFEDGARERGKPLTDDDLPVSRAFAGPLVIYIGENHDGAFAYPIAGKLKKSVGDTDRAFTRAAINTKRLEGQVKIDRVGNLILLSADESLGGSLVLDDGLWERPDLALGKHPLVAVLKDMVIAVNGDDPDAERSLRGALQTVANNTDFLTDDIYQRRDGGWVVLPKL